MKAGQCGCEIFSSLDQFHGSSQSVKKNKAKQKPIKQTKKGQNMCGISNVSDGENEAGGEERLYGQCA